MRKSSSFLVENIKCGGCMRSIEDGLLSLESAQGVKINQELGEVSVSFDPEQLSEDAIINKLASMGYPLAGHNSLGNKAVSYVSCMIGRMK
jgi:copper chaperone CopZ